MRWRVSKRVVEEDMVTVAAAMAEREREREVLVVPETQTTGK